jgi:hypothetical protein
MEDAERRRRMRVPKRHNDGSDVAQEARVLACYARAGWAPTGVRAAHAHATLLCYVRVV